MLETATRFTEFLVDQLYQAPQVAGHHALVVPLGAVSPPLRLATQQVDLHQEVLPGAALWADPAPWETMGSRWSEVFLVESTCETKE